MEKPSAESPSGPCSPCTEFIQLKTKLENLMVLHLTYEQGVLSSTSLFYHDHNLMTNPSSISLTFCSFPAQATNKKFSEIEKDY